MNKLFPIVLALMCFGFAEERTEVVQRYNNGAKKVVVIFKGYGLDEEIIKRYTFDINGDLKKFEDLKNPNNFYIKNPQLLNAEGLQGFLVGDWDCDDDTSFKLTQDSLFQDESYNYSSAVLYKNYSTVIIEKGDSLVINIVNDNDFVFKYRGRDVICSRVNYNE